MTASEVAARLAGGLAPLLVVLLTVATVAREVRSRPGAVQDARTRRLVLAVRVLTPLVLVVLTARLLIVLT